MFAWVKPYLRRSQRWRLGWAIAGVVAILLAAAVLWLAWFVFIPRMSAWGFATLSWRAIPAAAGIFFVSFLPLSAFVPGFTMLSQVAKSYIDMNESDLARQLDVIRSEQKTVEEQLGELESTDATGLMQLVKYSRLQLEAYYTIGLRQTQQSFRNSVIAMWLGFLIMLLGVLRQIVPLELLVPGIGEMPADVSTLTIAAGAVVELIAALFLWVYKSSVQQLTYFYDRQIHLHGVLISNKIASAMKEPDEAKKMIVTDILAKSWKPESTPLPTAAGLKKLVIRDKGAAAS